MEIKELVFRKNPKITVYMSAEDEVFLNGVSSIVCVSVGRPIDHFFCVKALGFCRQGIGGGVDGQAQ